MNGATRTDVVNFAKAQFQSLPESLWRSNPDYLVLRHPNGKWYGIIMDITKDKLGLDSKQKIDILVIKCDVFMQGSLLQEKGFYPAYHMSKEHWITIALDGSVDKEQVESLLALSYDMVGNKTK